jgi:XFP N-terminal domain
MEGPHFLDQPVVQLAVTCIIGDGEAETGALATCWHSNKFLNPARDGAVLPAILGREFRVAQAVAIYSRVTFCSYSYSASRCLTKSPIDTRPMSLSWRMTGRWRNHPLVIFSMAT